MPQEGRTDIPESNTTQLLLWFLKPCVPLETVLYIYIYKIQSAKHITDNKQIFTGSLCNEYLAWFVEYTVKFKEGEAYETLYVFK